MATKRPPAKKPMKNGYGFSSVYDIKAKASVVTKIKGDTAIKARESLAAVAEALAELTRIEVSAAKESNDLLKLLLNCDRSKPIFEAARDSRMASDELRQVAREALGEVKALLHDFIG